MPKTERSSSIEGGRRERTYRGYLAIAVVLLSAFFVGPGAGITGASSLQTGVTILDTISAADSPTAAARVKASGARFVTQWLRWDKVAPQPKPSNWNPTNPADPNYDWREVDHWVKAVSEKGLQPVLQLFGAPSWANRCEPPSDVYKLCDPDPSAMAAFAQAAARRYGGNFGGLPKVKYWQIQNEPNLRLFFNPQLDSAGKPLSPSIFRKLLKFVYESIKNVDQRNVVLAGGLAPNGVPGSLAPMAFTRKLLCMNRKNRPLPSPNACRGGVKFDVYDIHPYTSGGPTHKAFGRDNVQMGDLAELKQLLVAADKAGHIDGDRKRTPLWITEMSWDSRPPDPGGVKLSTLTRWTAEAMFQAWRVGIPVFFWYSLRDRPRGSGAWSDSDQSGLYFRSNTIEEDRPKPSLRAFRFPFVAYPQNRGARKRGGIVWGRTPSSKGGRVVIQVKRGSWRRVAVRRANSQGVFRGFVNSRLLSNKRGSVRAIYRGQKSPVFSLKPVKDYFQPPFG